VIIHVADEDSGGLTRTYFKDANPEHIERVREAAKIIAEWYIRLSKTEEYSTAPADVLAFYERHCVGIGRETDLSEIEAGLLADMDVSDEIIKKGEPQKPASYHISDAGRTYTLWDGVIVEELHNNTGFKNFGTSFDNNVYDFDLGVIIHTANEDSGGITRTRFKDADPAHIEHVRKIGLRIAEGYIKRSLTEEHSSAPDDVIAFYKRHYALQTASNEIVQETASKPQPIAP